MFLFVDTNIFVHYRPLDELRLTELLGTGDLKVVVPRVTIRELDQLKTSKQSRRVQDRVRRVLVSLLDAIETSKPLKGGLDVVYYRDNPFETAVKNRLSPQWADDLLVASMLNFREEHPQSELALLTADIGPRLTCKEYQLRAVSPDEDLRLNEELSDEDRQVVEDRRRLQKLQSASPRLTFGFEADGGVSDNASFVVQKQKTVDELVAEDLRSLIAATPRMRRSTDRPSPDLRGNAISEALHDLQFRGPFALDDAQIDEYNKEVDEYRRDVESSLRSFYTRVEADTRAIEFVLVLENIGSAPADDIDIYLEFSGQPVLRQVLADSLPRLPKPPEKPKPRVLNPPREWHHKLFTVHDAMAGYLTEPDPEIYRSPYETRVDRVKQGMAYKLERLAFQFPSVDAAASFSCRFRVIAANLPDSVSGELHFRITKE